MKKLSKKTKCVICDRMASTKLSHWIALDELDYANAALACQTCGKAIKSMPITNKYFHYICKGTEEP